jgi:hypothetical protein
MPQNLPVELVTAIRNAYAAVQAARANALARGLDTGDALLKLQETFFSGCKIPTSWQLRLEEECSIPWSTAKLYMQLARHRDDIEAEMIRVPELSLRAARRLISKKSPPASQDKSAAMLVSTEIAGADIGPNSKGENERLLARVEHEKRRLEIENVGLRSEIEEMKAEFAAGRMLRAVSNEDFFSELVRRVSNGVWKKHQTALRAIRRALDSEHLAGPALDLKANSVSNDEATKH